MNGYVPVKGIGAKTPEPRNDPVIERVYADKSGTVHIVTANGSDQTIPKEKDQVGSELSHIADDKKTVGWLATFDNCCTSYPIALKLIIYRDGKVRQLLGDGMMIYDWRFWDGGRQAAFCSGTVHGDSGGHCELHDANTGRAVTTIDGHLDENSPPWARGLNN